MCQHKIDAFFHVGGRKGCWDKFSEFLDKQIYPHDQIRLIVVNTTPQHKFYKEWLDKCDYEHVYHETPLLSNTCDRESRLKEMCKNQVSILNNVNANFLWTLDDDIIPPLDVVSQLLPHFTGGEVLAVSACYRLAPRIGMSQCYCCWPIDHKPKYYAKSHGVQIVGGACWGCCLFRCGEDCKLLWSFGPEPGVQADVAVYRRIHYMGGLSKVNWDVECHHLDDDGNNPFPSLAFPVIRMI